MKDDGVRALPAGEAAILLEFGQEIDVAVNREVQRAARALLDDPPPGVVGVIPAYTTVLVEFDPLVTTADAVASRVRRLVRVAGEPPPRRFLIPTRYGGDEGPDLEELAGRLGLSPEAVVRLHTAQDYRIFCLGFSPGFPLAGILPEALATPRRPSPRSKVPAGSVGLAGRQTGIYPSVSPGGWQLIGRTPVPLFDLRRDPPVPYRPGDLLRFVAVDRSEFRRLEGLERQGRLAVEEAKG